MSDLDLILKILVSICIGAAIGFQRGRKDKPAGIRTMGLVTAGSCLFTIISQEFGEDSRVAAQIVSGVGFLGAGAIWYDGNVKGLTTASAIWVCAALGMLVGIDRILAAIGLTLILAIFIEWFNLGKEVENL